MAELPIGLRDQLITAALQQVLVGMEAERVRRDPLEDAEAPARLARYAMDEIRTVLAVGGTAEQQAIRVNDLLRTLGVDGDGAGVSRPPEILTGVLGARDSVTSRRCLRGQRRLSARAICSSTPRASQISARSYARN
jgi:hypothetical protein